VIGLLRKLITMAGIPLAGQWLLEKLPLLKKLGTIYQGLLPFGKWTLEKMQLLKLRLQNLLEKLTSR